MVTHLAPSAHASLLRACRNLPGSRCSQAMSAASWAALKVREGSLVGAQLYTRHVGLEVAVW